MGSEEKLKDFQYNCAFNSICYKIKNKSDLNENSKVYIDWARSYFKDITKSLDSILDDSKEMYHITPHLKEVLECSGKYHEKMSLEEITKLKEEIVSLNKNLDNLKKDPHKFYETKEAEEVFNFLNKLVPCFD